MRVITSVEGVFGGRTYYDECGNFVGESRENIFGGETIYDAGGRMVGTSRPNLFGGEDIFLENPPTDFSREYAVPNYDFDN